MGAQKRHKAIFFTFHYQQLRYQLIKTTPETVNPFNSIFHFVLLPFIGVINPPVLHFLDSFETLIIVGGPQGPDFCTLVLRSHPLMRYAHPRHHKGKQPNNHYQYLAKVRLLCRSLIGVKFSKRDKSSYFLNQWAFGEEQSSIWGFQSCHTGTSSAYPTKEQLDWASTRDADASMDMGIHSQKHTPHTHTLYLMDTPLVWVYGPLHT